MRNDALCDFISRREAPLVPERYAVQGEGEGKLSREVNGGCEGIGRAQGSEREDVERRGEQGDRRERENTRKEIDEL